MFVLVIGIKLQLRSFRCCKIEQKVPYLECRFEIPRDVGSGDVYIHMCCMEKMLADEMVKIYLNSLKNMYTYIYV